MWLDIGRSRYRSIHGRSFARHGYPWRLRGRHEGERIDDAGDSEHKAKRKVHGRQRGESEDDESSVNLKQRTSRMKLAAADEFQFGRREADMRM